MRGLVVVVIVVVMFVDEVGVDGVGVLEVYRHL